MKINIFRGDLTDTSAKKGALLGSCKCCVVQGETCFLGDLTYEAAVYLGDADLPFTPLSSKPLDTGYTGRFSKAMSTANKCCWDTVIL